jgi:hypothetical protein
LLQQFQHLFHRVPLSLLLSNLIIIIAHGYLMSWEIFQPITLGYVTFSSTYYVDINSHHSTNTWIPFEPITFMTKLHIQPCPLNFPWVFNIHLLIGLNWFSTFPLWTLHLLLFFWTIYLYYLDPLGLGSHKQLFMHIWPLILLDL